MDTMTQSPPPAGHNRPPPYDPEAMCLLVEHSNSLRQNVDAYATNIDGFGFRFDPVIDFEAEDAPAREPSAPVKSAPSAETDALWGAPRPKRR